jgi:hypothetical protein
MAERRSCRICAFLLLLTTGYCVVAQEELNSAFVTVAVSDTLGGAIPNAQIHFLGRSPENKKEQVTDETGEATVELRPDTFDLNVASPGFQLSVMRGMELKPGEHRRINVVLKVKCSHCSFADPSEPSAILKDIEPERVELGNLKESTRPAPEQIRFGLEESALHPVPLPQAVLKILMNDGQVRTSRCVSEDEQAQAISASWFEASQIHLDGPDEVDLLVKSKNGCLFGANIGPFWIFRNTPQGYQLVLNVSALVVTILRSRTNGLSDVSAGAVAGGEAVSVRFKFDGHKYKESLAKPKEAK